MLKLPSSSDTRTPLGNYAFHVSFETEGRDVPPEPFGAFSEVSGLEATMEPKVIKEGGNNYGAQLRVGPVSFATVILKRGLVELDNLWDWWAYFAGAAEGANAYPSYANRCDVLIGQIGLRPFKPEPEKPKEGEYHYKDTRDTMFGKATIQVDAYNTFGRKPAEPPKPIDPIPEIRLVWRLRNAMPVKFRAGDLNAKGTDVAMEELHLMHEGLRLERPQQ
jgi:phage tail-like protein